MSLNTHIKNVQDKLQKLLKNYLLLKKENGKLKEDLHSLKTKEAEYINEIEAMQQQVIILKAAAIQMDEKDKKEFEKKINQYIKDIDNCITVLSH